MELVLVRHAESIWNAEQRWQGQSDVALSTPGHAEARRLGARLAGVHFDRRICSDLARTCQTAASIAGATFERDRDWREIDLGRWGGLLHRQVEERFPDELEAMQHGLDVPLGGGESVPGFEARVHAALERLVASSRDGDRVLVVTHGGVIRAVTMRALDLRARRALVGVGNTSITHLRFARDLSAQLISYNCDDHLARESEETEELVRGGGEETVKHTLAHLGLPAEAAKRFQPPPPTTITRLVRGHRQAALRAYAVPALSQDP
jgi:broad specificity phosphatase PhoE